ncbi:uncharacterized protein B0H18DRAFT_1210787 [Fomitopsis serialis]|uniref:uncharacterized protein n=1 Tax=Fomitopsis serialis TaxID=139415 RepID=UPI002008B87D|nr:uncharacterized protein B0H18DRAFT_1210787 [Neoantrodia serialis]KAH9926867.1 hypothetical protein B0H18DRAFT_1210787 [Neoantrodia serialis]
MMRKPWALGWLVDTEAVVELSRCLNLVRGPKADDGLAVEDAGVKYIVSRLWWPYMMECLVDDNENPELVFAIYVDNKRRSYPPRWIPRSQMLSRKWADKLNELMPLKGRAQWYRCVDGSHTPWRYPDDDDDENEVWVDVLHTLPQPEPEEEAAVDVVVEEYEVEYGEYHEEEVEYDVGAEEDLVESYEDDQESNEVVDYAEDGEEYLEEGEQGMTGYQDSTDYDDGPGAMVGGDGETAVYADERGAVDFEDDDSDTVRGDEGADVCAGDGGDDAVGYVGANDDRHAISSEANVHRGRVEEAPSSGSVEFRSEVGLAGAAEDAL